MKIPKKKCKNMGNKIKCVFSIWEEIKDMEGQGRVIFRRKIDFFFAVFKQGQYYDNNEGHFSIIRYVLQALVQSSVVIFVSKEK